MKRKNIIIITVLFIGIIVTLLFIFAKKTYSIASNYNDAYTLQRINEIRSTGNTDISDRTGKIYYVSTSGNDSNDEHL